MKSLRIAIITTCFFAESLKFLLQKWENGFFADEKQRKFSQSYETRLNVKTKFSLMRFGKSQHAKSGIKI